MNIRKTALTIAFGTLATIGFAASASADTPWQRHHPRREEVNIRLHNLNDRIRDERLEGDLTPMQAHVLHGEVRTIRGQERFAAHFNHGHITRAEQRALNQEENGVSGHIGY